MKNKLPVIAVLCVASFASCKKMETLNSKKSVVQSKAAHIPTGFNWQNSRTIKFVVNITDTRYGNQMHVLSLYNGDPASKGILISQGAANNQVAFESSVYLTKLATSVYIVKTAPDNSTSVSRINVGETDIVTSISK